MLTLHIPQKELYNRKTQEFFYAGPFQLQLEHSLKSIQKWEARTHKSYFKVADTGSITGEEFMLYIECMTVSCRGDGNVYSHLRAEDVRQIVEYINDPMSAKTFLKEKRRGPKYQFITNENYYYMMIQYGIPIECENWHFNRLLALIKTFESNGSEGKPMNYREQLRYWDQLNEARLKKFKTKG